MCFKIINNKWISDCLLLWMWLSEIFRVRTCLQVLFQTQKFTRTCNMVPYFTVTALTGTYKEVTTSLRSLLLPCSTSTVQLLCWSIYMGTPKVKVELLQRNSTTTSMQVPVQYYVIGYDVAGHSIHAMFLVKYHRAYIVNFINAKNCLTV